MILLEEYDNNKNAIINPHDMVNKIDNMPEIAITCFSHVLFNKIVEGGKCQKIAKLNNTNMLKDIYSIEYNNHTFALFLLSVGAPAAVNDLEDIHAMGVKKFIVFGNCGVLDNNIADCGIIIPNKALRDEGTSYHYLPPSDSIPINNKYLNEFKEILAKYGFSYTEGTTWTNDAFYRETTATVDKRRKLGAITVEMEASALQAVADFRNFDLFIFFYAADNLASDAWDKRSLSGDVKLDEKSQIAYLALDLALKISK